LFSLIHKYQGSSSQHRYVLRRFRFNRGTIAINLEKMLRTTRFIHKTLLSDRSAIPSSIKRRINQQVHRKISSTISYNTVTVDRGLNHDVKHNNNNKNDRLLVVGSGVAGSAAALMAAEIYHIPVTVLFAGNVPQDCNSNWAQGGIIYRNYDPTSGDSADSLAMDIHRAGAGLCVDDAVRKVSEEGPDRVRQLLLRGGPFADVPFDKTPHGELSLCLGKSHSIVTFSYCTIDRIFL
jgi:NADPH:quinone reductase-like Zn-dependent oxidoreductase